MKGIKSMSLFNKTKTEQSKVKKEVKIDDSQTERLNSSGWDAITNECNRIYPNQENPKHYGTLISWKFGDTDCE